MDFIRRNSLLVTPGSEGLMITVLASSLRDLGLSPGPWPCLCVMCMGDIVLTEMPTRAGSWPKRLASSPFF